MKMILNVFKKNMSAYCKKFVNVLKELKPV